MDTLTLDADVPSRPPPDGDRRPHAVVIGSGFGGLAAAVRLGARGYRVSVLEKRSTLGGRAAVYRQDGFTFDAGPTIVTAPFLFEELWALCGRRLSDDVELRPVSPFYAIRFATGEVFHYTGDAQAMPPADRASMKSSWMLPASASGTARSARLPPSGSVTG